MTNVEGGRRSREEAQQLVITAFERARDSGKAQWHRMTSAVLKNRLLELTHREFDESHWGADSFRDFVELIGDVVEVDESVRPAVLELRAPLRTQLSDANVAPGPTRYRVRSDLWNAVIDFTSAAGWVWDDDRGQAVPVDTADDLQRQRVLPTLSPEELTEWRTSFAEQAHDRFTQLGDNERVRRWLRGEGGSEHLPRDLRGDWFEFLKERVVVRLQRWFSSEEIDLPSTLLEARQPPRRDHNEVEQLRRLVVSVVQTMSLDELRALHLPAGAIVKAHRP